MSIIRTEHYNNNPYVMIRKEILENEDISWDLKGFYCYLVTIENDPELFESEINDYPKFRTELIRLGLLETVLEM